MIWVSLTDRILRSVSDKDVKRNRLVSEGFLSIPGQDL